jgi:hypothetical protein
MKLYRGISGFIRRSSVLAGPTWLAAAGNRAPATAADRRKSGAGNEGYRVGGFDCSCLSAPRRAQHLFAGSR